MKNLSIFISEYCFFSLVSLGKVRQGISRRISLSLTIINLEVVSKEFLYPADLIRTRNFCIYEFAKGILDNKNKHLVLATFQVMAPSLESLNDG